MAAPSSLEEEKLPLRVLIDSKRNKVIFAEADSDFVDILFSFMTLPLGSIVRLLDKHFGPQGDVMRSLTTLNDSLKKLDSTYFWTEETKLMLLNPRNSLEMECQNLKLNIDDSEPTKFFICEDGECIKKYRSVSKYDVTRCQCGSLMNREISFYSSNLREGFSKRGVFTTPGMCFLIRDDLQVTSNLVGSSIELLNSLGIKDMTNLEQRTCFLGLKEIISLLKCSLVSDTPLSDVILHNKSLKSETFCSALPQMSKTTTTKMVLKVIVHKSTKKVFFAEAEQDFVDFLFSLLTIPLGSVVSLLCGDTSLRMGSIVNLFKSISCLNTKRYLRYKDVKTVLLDPTLPHQYLCRNQILSLSEKPPPKLLFNSCCVSQESEYYLSDRPPLYRPIRDPNTFTCSVTIKDPKGRKEGFVRGPGMFMVTDDLEITPFSLISGLNFLNKLGIPFCDVEERVLNIGTEEAFGILRESLSSSSALTNGLNLTSDQQPKQEH